MQSGYELNQPGKPVTNNNNHMNTQQESKQTSRIMKTIEALTDNLENSRLDPEKISQSAAELDELAAFMEANRTQALLFAAILSLNFKKRRVSVEGGQQQYSEMRCHYTG